MFGQSLEMTLKDSSADPLFVGQMVPARKKDGGRMICYTAMEPVRGVHGRVEIFDIVCGNWSYPFSHIAAFSDVCEGSLP